MGLVVWSSPAGYYWAWAYVFRQLRVIWLVTRSSSLSHTSGSGYSNESKQDIDAASSIRHAWTSSRGNSSRTPQRKERLKTKALFKSVGSTLATVSLPKQVMSHKESLCGKGLKLHVKEDWIREREEFVTIPESKSSYNQSVITFVSLCIKYLCYLNMCMLKLGISVLGK